MTVPSEALDDEVAHGVVLEDDIAAQDVVEDGAAGGHVHGERVRLSGLLAAPDLFRSQRPALARVHRATALLLRGGALRLELFGRAEAGVQVAALEQTHDVLVVDAVALGLPVRAVRPGHARALVPLQAHLLHRGDDLHDGLVRTPAEVGVLDTEDERALMLTGEDEVVESCPCAAEVQVTSRRRSEADTGMRGLDHRPPIIPHRSRPPGGARVSL